MSWDDVAADYQAELLPENEKAFSVFFDLGTQWRVRHSGPYGLDYNVIPFVMRSHRIPRDEWPDMFADIRVMESAALDEMQKNG